MTFSSLGLQGAARRVATATVTAPNVIRGSLVQRHSWMRASQSLQLPKPSGLRPFSSQGALRDEQKPSPPPGMLTCSPHASPIACAPMRGIDVSYSSSTLQAPMAIQFTGAALFSTGRVVPVCGLSQVAGSAGSGHGSSSRRMAAGPPASTGLGDTLSPKPITFPTIRDSVPQFAQAYT